MRRVPISWRVNSTRKLYDVTWDASNDHTFHARGNIGRMFLMENTDSGTGKTADSRHCSALPWELHRPDLYLTYACEKEKEYILILRETASRAKVAKSLPALTLSLTAYTHIQLDALHNITCRKYSCLYVFWIIYSINLYRR